MSIHTGSGSCSVVADLRTFAPLGANPYIITVAGLHAFNDNYGGDFQWSDTESAADDDDTIIRPSMVASSDPGRWVRVTDEFNRSFISGLRRIETYLGTTNTSGNYTVTYATAFAAVPDVQPQLQAGTPTQTARITASTTTGFTINVQNRTDVIGLLPSYANVNGASVSVLVTAR